MSSAFDSWYHEKESAWLYGHVAAAEPDPIKQRLFLQLAAAAEHQSATWASKDHGRSLQFHPSTRARVVAWLVARIGPRSMKPVLAAMKLRGLSVYGVALATPGHEMPTTLADVGARHKNSIGGNLRATVFGVNDGLLSNASLVIGVAGAGAANNFILMSGAAGLLAGALSMAAGEFVSVRSQREMYEYQIALERDEVAEYPDEEAEELALIYHARGVTLEQARSFSRSLLANPEHALDVLAREELGLNPDDLGSPWGAAIASFLSFAIGACLPLLPFILRLNGPTALLVTATITLVALFGVGLTLSLFTGRSAWHGALRMTLIGGGVGLLAYFVGHLLGVAIG
ncbi:MAG TPA: VIT1/CCC1 transporter family protein [Steroidobacteraceae bacterium]